MTVFEKEMKDELKMRNMDKSLIFFQNEALPK
jgi:hypothetical protein